MHEPIDSRLVPRSDLQPQVKPANRSRLRNALARRKLERRYDRHLLRKHIREVWQ